MCKRTTVFALPLQKTLIGLVDSFFSALLHMRSVGPRTDLNMGVAVFFTNLYLLYHIDLQSTRT